MPVPAPKYPKCLRTVRTLKIRPRTPLSEESAVPPYELLEKDDAEVAKREQASWKRKAPIKLQVSPSLKFGEAQVQRALEEQNCANSPALQNIINWYKLTACQEKNIEWLKIRRDFGSCQSLLTGASYWWDYMSGLCVKHGKHGLWCILWSVHSMSSQAPQHLQYHPSVKLAMQTVVLLRLCFNTLQFPMPFHVWCWSQVSGAAAKVGHHDGPFEGSGLSWESWLQDGGTCYRGRALSQASAAVCQHNAQ